MSAGRFRPDLFERLNIIVLNLPPLRQIKEDIPLLVEHFIRLYDTGRPAKRISDAALDMLMHHDWPRNVRELKNVIERTLLFMDGDVINLNDLRINTYSLMKAVREAEGMSLRVQRSNHEQIEAISAERSEQEEKYTFSIPVGRSLEEIKLEAIRQTLDAFDGNKTHTAKALGISTSTLWKALKTIKKYSS